MVFSCFGFALTEAEIREACDCTQLGVSGLQAVDAARLFGFSRTAKHNLKPEELAAVVQSGSYPIVFVNLFPITGVSETHAIVVIDVTATAVQVYDPDQGEVFLPHQIFNIAWELKRNLAIIVEE